MLDDKPALLALIKQILPERPVGSGDRRDVGRLCTALRLYLESKGCILQPDGYVVGNSAMVCLEPAGGYEHSFSAVFIPPGLTALPPALVGVPGVWIASLDFAQSEPITTSALPEWAAIILDLHIVHVREKENRHE